MRNFKVFAILLLILQLALPMGANASSETDLTIQYTALGDSLAAGVNEKGEVSDYGYSDNLARKLVSEEWQVRYNKGFAFPGYTTENVLADLKGNVSKASVTLEGLQKDSVQLSESIANSDLITISAGANDVLKFVTRSETGEVKFDLAGVMKGVQAVATNYQTIFSTIKEINPSAEVVVMGYYNPFPYLDVAYQPQLTMLVQALDEAVEKTVIANGGTFIKVADLIAENYLSFLPNPKNIHLSKEGYEAVAGLMFDAYMNVRIEESVVGDTYFSDVAGHWAEDDINFAASIGILGGHADGTFKPNDPMKRVQLISVIARTFELKEIETTPFIDIEFYAEQTRQEIAAAYHVGIVSGYGDYLKPQEKVTRAQLALMVARAYTHSVGEAYVPEKLAPFIDMGNYNLETQQAITLLYDFELAQGVSANQFSPGEYVTRAQAAKILSGLFETIEN